MFVFLGFVTTCADYTSPRFLVLECSALSVADHTAMEMIDVNLPKLSVIVYFFGIVKS